MSAPQPEYSELQNSPVINLPSHNDIHSHSAFNHVTAINHHLRELAACLKASSKADFAKSTEPDHLSFWDLIELAKQFEAALNQRGLIDLHIASTLTSPAGVEMAGTNNTVSFLVDHLGISRREASERVKAAKLDGDIEPDNTANSLSPEAASDVASTAQNTEAERQAQQEQQRIRSANARLAHGATAEGNLTTQTRTVIYNELSRLLPNGKWTAEEVKSQVYTQLDSLNAAEIRTLTREMVNRSNAVVTKPKDPNVDLRRRNLYVSRPDADGCITINGTLDAAASTLALKLFGDYAVRGYGIELPEGHDDKRTFGQRNADAFTKILKDAMSAANRKTNNRGGLASIVAVVDAADFAGSSAGGDVWWDQTFQTSIGTALNAAQLLRLGVTDNLLLSLIDTRQGLSPVDMSMFSGQRIAGFEQRIALQIIDGCCQHPGCERAVDDCDIHHIVPFIAGGRTDIENLVPLCRTHHRRNDDSWAAPNRSHMSERTQETNFRSGIVRIDGKGVKQEPKFNNGPTTRRAPGYVPPPNSSKAPPAEQLTRRPGTKPPGQMLEQPSDRTSNLLPVADAQSEPTEKQPPPETTDKQPASTAESSMSSEPTPSSRVSEISPSCDPPEGTTSALPFDS